MTHAGRRLTLFVTRDAPRSRRARENLARALQAAGRDGTVVDEICALADPATALRYDLHAAPALVLEGDDLRGGYRVLYGDLSDPASLQRMVDDWLAPCGWDS